MSAGGIQDAVVNIVGKQILFEIVQGTRGKLSGV